MQSNPKRPTSNQRITPSKRRVIIEDLNESDEDTTLLTSFESLSIKSITNVSKLDQAIDLMLQSFKQSQLDYDLPEIHAYVQILPDIFYKPGSHEMNRKVAFALKHTDERLFLSWVKLRSKADDFDWNSIPQLFYQWNKYYNQSQPNNDIKLTKKSIIYWAKHYAFEQYKEIKQTAISAYIESTLKFEKIHPEFDIATVLYQIYKDEYVFVINGKNTEWYRFAGHRWKLDKGGSSLRLRLSTELYNLYSIKQTQLINEKAMLRFNTGGGNDNDSNNNYTQADINETVDITEIEKQNKDKDDFLKKKLTSITLLMTKLKSTSNKNSIMKEAQDLFLDAEFEEKRDENKNLLGFSNGVFDFKQKCFRDGQPDDYITMSTNIEYKPINSIDNNEKN